MKLSPTKHLDIILYSREQLVKEREAMKDMTPVPDEPWGIISVKAQVREGNNFYGGRKKARKQES